MGLVARGKTYRVTLHYLVPKPEHENKTDVQLTRPRTPHETDAKQTGMPKHRLKAKSLCEALYQRKLTTWTRPESDDGAALDSNTKCSKD